MLLCIPALMGFYRQRAAQLTVEIAQHAGVEQFIVGFDGRGTGGSNALLQQLFELLRVVENKFGSAVDGLGPHRFGLTITTTKAKERHAIGRVGLQAAHLSNLLHLVNILAQLLHIDVLQRTIGLV